MRIALISVAPPYRGGISKHTSILVDLLSLKHSVKVINYKRQYPDFLFPGKTQYIENKTNIILGERCIDSVNPITWFLTGKRLVDGRYDLVIFRFWNPFFAPALSIIAIILRKKMPNTKLISLSDNILPHESMIFGRFLTRYMFHKMHGHIVQSSQTENELHEITTNPIYKKRFHPIYNTYSDKINKKLARKKLSLETNNIILYFGLIRPYKGFDILLKAMALLKEKNMDFHLLVAGECYENKRQYIQLIDDLKISEFITWHDWYIPDEDVNIYFSAADVAALPYRSASQSGIVQIAYNYNLPVIVTRVGGLPEIVQNGKSGFVIDSENQEELAKVLYENLGTPILNKMEQYIQGYKGKFSWEYFIDGIEKVYQQI